MKGKMKHQYLNIKQHRYAQHVEFDHVKKVEYSW
jgi:hypothetical protein